MAKNSANQPDNDLKQITVNGLKTSSKRGNDLTMLTRGRPSVLEAMLPKAIERGMEIDSRGHYLPDEDYIKVDNQYTRTLSIVGFPNILETRKWKELFESKYNPMISARIEPMPKSEAMKKINDELVSVGSFNIEEQRKGHLANATRLPKRERELFEAQEAIEDKTSNLFQVQVLITLQADSKKGLDQATRNLVNDMSNTGFALESERLVQDKAYKSVLPLGKVYVFDNPHNFNTGSLVSMFPFFNAELNHPHGSYFGTNWTSKSPIFIDFWDTRVSPAHNVMITARTGRGKTTMMQTMLARETVKGTHAVYFDQDGEAAGLLQMVHGKKVSIGQGSKQIPNMFDVEPEYSLEPDGHKTVILDINSKALDIAATVNIMYPELTSSQRASVQEVVIQTYQSFGIINDKPETIFLNTSESDKISREELAEHGIPTNRARRRMPQFSDFLDKMEEMYSDGRSYQELKEVHNVLRQFRKGNVMGMFDTQTPDNLTDIFNNSLVVIDLHNADSNDEMSIISRFLMFTWVWEKFGKSDANLKKIIAIDEVWRMLQNPSNNRDDHRGDIAGKIINDMWRRGRKHNLGMWAATQQINDLMNDANGQGIYSQSDFVFLGQQDTLVKDSLNKKMQLKLGIINWLINTASVGEWYIKIGNDDYLGTFTLFSNELESLQKNKENLGS